MDERNTWKLLIIINIIINLAVKKFKQYVTFDYLIQKEVGMSTPISHAYILILSAFEAVGTTGPTVEIKILNLFYCTTGK